MAEKVAGGSWHEAPPGGPAGADAPPEAGPEAAKRAEEDRLQGKRDSARWTAVVGFALLFLGGFSAMFVTGGALMVLYGVVVSVYWGRRLRRLKGDPWAYDPELDGPDAAPWLRP